MVVVVDDVAASALASPEPLDPFRLILIDDLALDAPYPGVVAFDDFDPPGPSFVEAELPPPDFDFDCDDDDLVGTTATVCVGAAWTIR